MGDSDIRLNENQRRAVEHSGTPLIVLAGPGSGKTRVIVQRIAYLIEERGAEPESIVALTFTNKAAEEMRRRLAEILGSSARAERVVASTFHSFGLRLIRQFADLAGWRSEPMIVDEGQQRALMRMVIEESESEFDLSQMPYDRYSALRPALQFIGICRNRAIFPEDVQACADRWEEDFAKRQDELDDEARLAEQTKLSIFRHRCRLFHGFEEACYARGWVTFDDLQAQALRLLREHDEVRAIVRTDYRHIVVDEFQDVNRAQIELLKCLAGLRHDLCVVGDDDQAIYGFRGSIPSGFRFVTEHWSDTQTIQLTENYRSTAVIVNAADQIIGKCEDRFNPDKRLIAAGENAPLNIAIEGVSYAGQSHAGVVISAMILDLVERGEATFGETAVLVRTNTELGRVAAILQAVGVPVDVPELSEIASHPLVLDTLCWLRLLDDPGDDGSLTRLLIRPPFDINILTITDWVRAFRMAQSENEKQEFARESSEENGGESTSNNPIARTFLEYLIANPPNTETRQFAEMYEKLRSHALTETADVLTLAIINETGMLSLDPVNTTEHQVRLENLGRFLGFVRERIPMLESPMRARQFLTYFDDLSAVGAAMTLGGTAADRMDSGVALAREDAVRILTAHKSKGLEFDTVFIPQVNSPNGYPMKKKGSTTEVTELIPADLLVDDLPSDENDERRVFFTALTRARKRVILMTMSQQDGGRRCKPSIYWNDLTDDDAKQAGIAMRVRESDEILREIRERYDRDKADGNGGGNGGENGGGNGGGKGGENGGGRGAMSGWIEYMSTISQAGSEESGGLVHGYRERELFNTRHAVYGILHALHHGDLSARRIMELQNELSLISLRLPVLAADTPEQLESVLAAIPDGQRDTMRKYSQEIVTRNPWYQTISPPKSPLVLSYSQIEQYIRCPRCYWLRNIVGLREQSTIGTNFGSIIHRTLEMYYKRLQQSVEFPDQITIPTLDDLQAFGHTVYEELRGPDENWSHKMEQDIQRTLSRYYERLHTTRVNPVFVEQSVTFDYPLDDVTHRIKARMDRVDFDGEGYHVIDYKTGKPTKTRLEPKTTDLQLGVYLLALRAFLEDDEPVGSAQYWLTRTGERGVIDFADIKLNGVRKKIDKAITGILAGDWDVSKTCRNCELLSVGWSDEYESQEAEISP